MPLHQPDVLIVGGGVIGLTTALCLADKGLSISLLDRQATGQEASWAGAGMLPPGNLQNAATSEARLRAYSHSLWAGLSQRLLEQTGIDNGYRVCGAVNVFNQDDGDLFLAHCQAWTKESIRFFLPTSNEAIQYVPDLNPTFKSTVYLPDFAQVRNPRHLQALRAACLHKGVEIIEHVSDVNLVAADGRIVEARLPDRTLSFATLCITAGSWSTSILQSLGVEIPVRPIRGQIVQLQMQQLPFNCVIEHGRRYLVPRQDGLILVGSTQEDVGFEKKNTAEGVAQLLEFAVSLVPALRHAEVVRCWSGLRPASPDELPILGAVPGLSNVFVGAGHFRSGLQMSPGSAAILADVICGSETVISLEGLTIDRFQPTHKPQSVQPF
jgi:glycine oxidase